MAKDVSARETSSVAWPAWVASWVAKATVSLASKPSGVATNDFKISSSAINFGDRPRRKMLVIDRAEPGNERGAHSPLEPTASLLLQLRRGPANGSPILESRFMCFAIAAMI